jgi:hypothetical protein
MGVRPITLMALSIIALKFSVVPKKYKIFATVTFGLWAINRGVGRFE